MSTETTDYLQKASDDAGATIQNFADEILEQLLDDGKASDDLLNDYPNGDSWHHECHTDKAYSFRDAADVLDQLDEFEEGDSGIWEGQDMKTAVSACAAYTYGNAVYNEWRKKIEQINRDAEGIIANYNDQQQPLEDEISDLEGEVESAKDEDAARQHQSEVDALQTELASLDDKKKAALVKLIQDTADIS